MIIEVGKVTEETKGIKFVSEAVPPHSGPN
jgi:hypothetical protein